jgi:hypothetical protein
MPGAFSFRGDAMWHKLIDLTGKRFGHRTVLAIHPERVRYGKKSHVLWLCRCDCGAERLVLDSNLRRGQPNSCGCRRIKHGHARGRQTRVYKIWASMKQRCYNPNHPRYVDWGGRGICVCERWHSFANFFADMGEPPPGKTIDRCNNDGNYEPGNCKWATCSEQRRNQRSANRKGRRSSLADIQAYTESLARAGART